MCSDGLNDFRGFERDDGRVFYVKEIFTFQFVIFHAAAGVHAVSLDLDVQNAAPRIRGGKLYGGAPFVEGTFDGNRRVDTKFDGAFAVRDFIDRNLGTVCRRKSAKHNQP